MTHNIVSLWKKITAVGKAAATVAVFCPIVATTLLVGAFSAQAQTSGNLPVYLASSGNIPLDQHMQRLLKEELDDKHELVLISDEQAALIDGAPIVTIGPRSFTRIRQANRKVPILATLIEQDFLQGFTSGASGQLSGVYYDVPLLRQALVGKAILPQATRIALMATSSTAELYETLIDQLPRYNLQARLFVVDDEKQLIPTLTRALSYGDFLLAAPDTAIYNPRTIKHILLTAYRRNKIVIGPSQAYVKAGVLASGYVPFPVMAQMASDYLKTYFESGKFPKPNYPSEFGVQINEQVARSLNIPLAPRERISQSINEWLNEKGAENE